MSFIMAVFALAMLLATLASLYDFSKSAAAVVMVGKLAASLLRPEWLLRRSLFAERTEFFGVPTCSLSQVSVELFLPFFCFLCWLIMLIENKIRKLFDMSILSLLFFYRNAFFLFLVWYLFGAVVLGLPRGLALLICCIELKQLRRELAKRLTGIASVPPRLLQY